MAYIQVWHCESIGVYPGPVYRCVPVAGGHSLWDQGFGPAEGQGGTMARVSDVEKDQAPDEVRLIYDKVQAAAGRVPNMVRLLAHFPKGLASFLPFSGALREGKLDPKLRELGYLKASQVNGCHY